QAVDGIRDATVSGVQTCALPISQQDPPVNAMEWAMEWAIVARDQQVIHSGLFPLRAPSTARTFIFAGCKYSPHPCAEPPTANPDKYADELLRVSGFVLANPEQTRLPRR